MAYMSQEKKAKIVARLKEEFPKWSFRCSVRHHSGIVVTIVRADVDFLNLARIENEKTFNPHDHYVRHIQSGMEVYGTLSRYFGKDEEAIEKMQKVIDAVNLVGDTNDANFDNSDPMTDYCHIGYYVYIKIGGNTESTEFQYVPAKATKKKVLVEEEVAETI